MAQYDNRRGFTLIELLIVIAIIGILTAIALPNFRNAQTRAKVARAKADIKTIVSGLEQYMIDNNAYPTYHYDRTNPYEIYIGGAVVSRLVSPPFDGRNPLTTPIKYITSFPNDPFNRTPKVSYEQGQYMYTNWPYAFARIGLQIYFDLFKEYGPYRLASKGPDTYGPDTGLPYDPTNGVSSTGDIIYAPRTGFADQDATSLDPNAGG